jgi:hypothetical protein
MSENEERNGVLLKAQVNDKLKTAPSVRQAGSAEFLVLLYDSPPVRRREAHQSLPSNKR